MVKKVIASAFLYYYGLLVNLMALIGGSVMLTIFIGKMVLIPSIAGGVFFITAVLVNVFYINRVIILSILSDDMVSYKSLLLEGLAEPGEITEIRYIYNNIASAMVQGKKRFFLSSKQDVLYLRDFCENKDNSRQRPESFKRSNSR